ncbi:hypothetical protein HUJ05_005401 [Dendroctonus ponderosae]|nr:hypothetical protein HUJ05_005401 [Dendroctonus ponderosae]
MSDLKAKLKSMQNKESNTDGITVKILKDAFQTIGDKVLDLEGKMIGVVLLDVKRAFETINRQLLLLKMKKYGFGDVILDWFGEYCW